MTAIRVVPQELATAGRAVAGTAASTAGAAGAVRSALSAIGAGAAHRGVECAAEDAGASWRSAVQTWAGAADDLGAALSSAAASYAAVDDAQVRGLP